MPVLSPAEQRQLHALALSTRTRLAGVLAGEHVSARHGSSTDFADFRDYNPGDDFRRIDFNVLARLDQLLIKLFDAEDEMPLRLLLDTSASMATGHKMRQATRVAGALGMVALTRRDPVTVQTMPFDGIPRRYLGAGAVPRLLAELSQIVATGDTPFPASVDALFSHPGPPGLSVVVSDLLTPDWEVALRRLPGGGGNLLVVHVLAAEEIDPDLQGDLDLVDVETGDRVPVSYGEAEARTYKRRVQTFRRQVADRCRSIGAGLWGVDDGSDVVTELVTTWRARGLVR